MLKLVSYKAAAQTITPLAQCDPESLGFHQQLVDGYLQSHKIRNHSSNTIDETKRLLKAWFGDAWDGLSTAIDLGGDGAGPRQKADCGIWKSPH